MLPEHIIARFWSRVDKSGECWEWTGGHDRNGYALFWDGSRTTGAHRIAYELANGPILEDYELDHLCRNRGCVNHEHLEPVSHLENMRRAPARIPKAPSGCRPFGHPYPKNEGWKRGVRYCKECNRIRARAWYERHRVGSQQQRPRDA